MFLICLADEKDTGIFLVCLKVVFFICLANEKDYGIFLVCL